MLLATHKTALDRPPRSRDAAALDLAESALRELLAVIECADIPGHQSARAKARRALENIATLRQ